MALFELYTKELQDEFGYLAAWLSNTMLSLGEVRVLKRDALTPVGLLDDFGIPYDAGPPSSAMPFVYKSQDAVDIQFGAEASGSIDPAVLAPGALRIEFSRGDAVVFIAENARTCASSKAFGLEMAFAKRRFLASA